MQRVIAVFGLALLSLGASYAVVAAFPEYDASSKLASIVRQPLAAEPILVRLAD
jgi:hypothetical protein